MNAINVHEAYVEATKLTNANHLKQILEFDVAFGFIFSDLENDGNDLCILIYKYDPKKSVLAPVSFGSLDFLGPGQEVPLSIIKKFHYRQLNREV